MLVPCLAFPGEHYSGSSDLVQHELIMSSPTPVRACLEGDTAAGQRGVADPCFSARSAGATIDDAGFGGCYASYLRTPESKGSFCQGGVTEHLISPSAHKIMRSARHRAERTEHRPVYHLLTPGASPSGWCGELGRQRSTSRGRGNPLPNRCSKLDDKLAGPGGSVSFRRPDAVPMLDLRFGASEDKVLSERQPTVKGGEHGRPEDCCWVRLGKSQNVGDAAAAARTGHIPNRKERSCSYSSLVDDCLDPETSSPLQTPVRPIRGR